MSDRKEIPTLESVLKTGERMGLEPRELETMKRQYLFGIMDYYDRHRPPVFSPEGLVKLDNNARMLGEAYALKYMRETIDNWHKGKQ